MDARLIHLPQPSEATLSFNKNLKITQNHRFVFNFANEHGGVFSFADYHKYLQSNPSIAPKLRENMLKWYKTTIANLEKSGYVKCVRPDVYQLNVTAQEWINAPKATLDFVPGRNHLKLLGKHFDGILSSVSLKSEYKDKSPRERERQSKMIDGMLRKLVANGYLERDGRSEYRLTLQGFETLVDTPKAVVPPQLEKSFKFGAEHYNLCKQHKNGHVGLVDLIRAARVEIVQKRDNALEKLERSIYELESGGYIAKIDDGVFKYTLRGAAAALLCPENMTMSAHGLLFEHKESLIEMDTLKAPIYQMFDSKSESAETAVLKHIGELCDNGYLIQKGDTYELTREAKRKLWGWEQFEAKPKSSPKLKITAFDRFVLEVADENGRIRDDFLAAHERKDSIARRVATFTQVGFIQDGVISKALESQIKCAVALQRSKKLTLDTLTPYHKKLLTDMRLFLNLKPGQILKYVYGNDKNLFSIDIELLQRHGVLEFDKNSNVYILGKHGVSLSGALLPNAKFYKSKVHTRPAEIRHDALLYSAFKEWERELLESGGKVTEVLTDRMLRSADAKKYGAMTGDYPDLRIAYKDKKGVSHSHDIEMDCGYDAKTIASKLSAFTGGVSWCCSTLKQAVKVANMAGDKSKRLNKHKSLSISYIDASGNVRKLKWS